MVIKTAPVTLKTWELLCNFYNSFLNTFSTNKIKVKSVSLLGESYRPTAVTALDASLLDSYEIWDTKCNNKIFSQKHPFACRETIFPHNHWDMGHEQQHFYLKDKQHHMYNCLYIDPSQGWWWHLVIVKSIKMLMGPSVESSQISPLPSVLQNITIIAFTTLLTAVQFINSVNQLSKTCYTGKEIQQLK